MSENGHIEAREQAYKVEGGKQNENVAKFINTSREGILHRFRTKIDVISGILPLFTDSTDVEYWHQEQSKKN